MPLALGVLLDGVGARDGSIAQVLTVHRLKSGIGRTEVIKGGETKAPGGPSVRVAHDSGRNANPKGAESIVEELLVNIRVKVSDEEVGTDLPVTGIRDARTS